MEFIANAEKKNQEITLLHHYYPSYKPYTNFVQHSTTVFYSKSVWRGGFYLVWDLMCEGSFYLVWDPLYCQLCPLHSELLSLSFTTFN